MNNKDEIEKIFIDVEINDLKRFINEKYILNRVNLYLMYLFYIVNAGGILITSISTINNNKAYIWCGIALTLISTIISACEKINLNQLKKLNSDIKQIKNNNYIVESDLEINLEAANRRRQSAISMLNIPHDEIPDPK